jgi:hypothetical protein
LRSDILGQDFALVVIEVVKITPVVVLVVSHVATKVNKTVAKTRAHVLIHPFYFTFCSVNRSVLFIWKMFWK